MKETTAEANRRKGDTWNNHYDYRSEPVKTRVFDRIPGSFHSGQADHHNSDHRAEPRFFAPLSGVRSLAGEYTESVKGASTLTDAVNVATSG